MMSSISNTKIREIKKLLKKNQSRVEPKYHTDIPETKIVIRKTVSKSK